MQRVLILEDEQLIAGMLADWLVEVGYEVCGLAKSVEGALELIGVAAPDAAILDLQLRDGTAYPVARALRLKDVPFVFATGRSSLEIEREFRNAPVASKPFDFPRLLDVLQSFVLPDGEKAVGRRMPACGANRARCDRVLID